MEMDAKEQSRSELPENEIAEISTPAPHYVYEKGDP
jgi:hypothetical protein